MEGPIAALRAQKRLAASCPATPNTAFLKAARPHTVCKADRIRAAQAPAAGSLQQDATARRQAKRQLFVQAADLAADLARLRKRIQDRLLHLPVCSSGSELTQPLGCSTVNSGAISLASACSRETDASLVASRGRNCSSELGSTMAVLRATALPQSANTPCRHLDLGKNVEDPVQLSAPQAAALSTAASPDLASMPPRIQRLAQARTPAHRHSIQTVCILLYCLSAQSSGALIPGGWACVH